MTLSAILSMAALGACNHNPEGGLYALACAVESTSKPILPGNPRTDIAGMNPGTIVFDEKHGKLFSVQTGIGYNPRLVDACQHKGPCNLRFDSRGTRLHEAANWGTADFFYDRAAMRLGFDNRYRHVPGPSPQVFVHWACKPTDFPDTLWAKRVEA